MKRAGNLRSALPFGILLLLLAGLLAGCGSVAASAAKDGTVVQLGSQQRTNDSATAVSLPAAFHVQSKWDWMEAHFELDVTTDEAPQEGVVFTADLLVQSSESPQFLGRMNVEVILLVGMEQRWAQCAVPAQVRAVNFVEPVVREGAVWYRTGVEVTFSGTVNTDVDGVWTEGVPYQEAVDRAITGVSVYLAGTQCDYTGLVRLENPVLGGTPGRNDGVSVNTTVPRHSETAVSMQEGALAFENGTQAALPQVALADPGAAEAAVQTARYLAAMGNSDHIVFGHQDSVWSKTGTVPSPLNGLTSSDVEDITGSLAGMAGFDGLSLVGSDFSAATWNRTFAQQGLPGIEIDAPGEPAANVEALARLSNYCLEQGSLVTLSCHMPNFSQVKERASYQAGKEPGYARYDFTVSNARDKRAAHIEDILPGGEYNAQFTAYLDMIADYAVRVEGAVLFRPFHEGTGSWFWWGTDTCGAETYQKVFRYTVEYLRDQKQVHNLLYVYSVDGNQGFMEKAEARYPGDAYVDVIGLDVYQTDPAPDSGEWFADVASGLSQLGAFAARHGKLLAVTETGMNTSVPAPGDVATGLPRTGGPDQRWFEELLDVVSASGACYVMVWSNNSEMFHIPFVRAVNSDGSLYGHELLDDFLRCYNDRRSVFATDQREVLSQAWQIKKRRSWQICR